MLSVNTKAPDFCLKDIDGKDVKLSSFKGKKVVVYFYPRDNTSGCSKQAICFKENYEEFKNRNVEVIGISKDTIASHVKFKNNFDLPFILLSDIELKTINDYDVLHEKKLYGKSYLGVVRTTYIIDENGMIISAKEKVNPTLNAKETLSILDNL